MSESSGRTATPERPRRDKGRRRSPLVYLRHRWGRMTLFLRQVVAELRKVVWPTRQQLITYTTVVMVFVLVMMAITSLLDLSLGWVVFKIFA